MKRLRWWFRWGANETSLMYPLMELDVPVASTAGFPRSSPLYFSIEGHIIEAHWRVVRGWTRS